MNTTKELLTAVKIEDLSHSSTDRNLYIFKEDTENVVDKTLTVDSITLFSHIYLLLNIHPLTPNNTNKYISMTNSELASVFKTYLKKKFPDTKNESILAFALNPGNEPTLVV